MTQTTAEYDFLYDSPTGKLGVCIDAESITKIIWLEQDVPETSTLSSSKPVNKKLEKKIISALDNYFNSGLIEAEISLCPDGTLFQKKVWQALKRIPSGTVKTYGDVARELQTSSRAVGQACRRNNIPLFIPCHRVVAAQGIGGFMGGYRHVERKRWLLQHEGIL
jgi:methylated-DNA-[protein]-cysteine S-methyltransferase